MMQRCRVTLLASSRPCPVLIPEEELGSALLGFTDATSNRWATADWAYTAPETHTATLAIARSMDIPQVRRSQRSKRGLGDAYILQFPASRPLDFGSGIGRYCKVW